MKLKSFIIFVFSFISQLLFSAGSVFAVNARGTCNINEIETAIGCVSTLADGSANSFFGSVIKMAIGLGGGLALLIMLYGIYVVTTSAGIPDKLKEGSEIITSAITGLIFVILSVFLLNLIGINILGLPGLT